MGVRITRQNGADSLTRWRKGGYTSFMDSLSRFAWITLPIVIIVATLVYVPMKLNDPQGFARVESLKRDIRSLKTKNRQIQRENASLKNQIRAIYEDPEYIENIARNEMGMIAPDEIVYQF